jgi:hypothetical protein
VLTGEFPVGAGRERWADQWIRWTTGCVVLLSLIAGTVSYPRMYTLVEHMVDLELVRRSHCSHR